jgi:hypothetical protein
VAFLYSLVLSGLCGSLSSPVVFNSNWCQWNFWSLIRYSGLCISRKRIRASLIFGFYSGHLQRKKGRKKPSEKSSESGKAQNQGNTNNDDMHTVECNNTLETRWVWPANLWSPYLEGHPCSTTHCQVLWSKGHKTLPSVVGPYFLWCDDRGHWDCYCAAMLALLTPWHMINQLKKG